MKDWGGEESYLFCIRASYCWLDARSRGPMLRVRRINLLMVVHSRDNRYSLSPCFPQ